MTLSQAINMVDDIKPNAFSCETKTAWINECEGLVQTEVLLRAIDDITVYDYDRDHGAQLLAKPPHDKIYWAYLSAMVDFGNGEYSRYQNTMQVFNSFFGEYQRWFALHYRPADGEAIEQGYYISAYGIAAAHGFEGTEEQWLESLHGRDGEMSFSELTPEEKAELKGDTGAQGPAATIKVGAVVTGAAGSPAQVTNSGTASAAVFDFIIPRGEAGPAATVEIGTVTTGEPGTPAQVTNSGTQDAAVLDFVIPRGNTGASGAGTGDMLESTYDPAGGARQVAFQNDVSAHTGNSDIHVTAAEKTAWSAKQDASARVTSLSSGSTDAQYPSAKCVFDYVTAQIAGAIGGSY